MEQIRLLYLYTYEPQFKGNQIIIIYIYIYIYILNTLIESIKILNATKYIIIYTWSMQTGGEFTCQTQILIHAKSWTESLLHHFMPRVFLEVRTAQSTTPYIVYTYVHLFGLLPCNMNTTVGHDNKLSETSF